MTRSAKNAVSAQEKEAELDRLRDMLGLMGVDARSIALGAAQPLPNSPALHDQGLRRLPPLPPPPATKNAA